MSLSIRERKIVAIKAVLVAAESTPGVALFGLVGRGNPVGQTVPKEKRPAVFLVELSERPQPNTQYDDATSFWRLHLGFVILGTLGFTPEQQSTELNALDSAIIGLVDNRAVGPGAQTMRRIGRDEPEANQSLPGGSTMPVYTMDYSHNKLDATSE